MTFKVADRVKESCTSPGTGTVTLLGAVSQFQSFSSAIGANNTTLYVIADQSGTNWEVGVGTVGAGGTTLARTTVIASSNAGSLVNFSTGSQYVFCDLAAEKALLLTDTGKLQAGLNSYLDWASAAPAVAAGRMWYDGTTGSWNLGMGNGNITQQVGEELFVYGKASAAITDSPLQIIKQTGVVGASGVITFAPTTSGITDGDLIVGVATESIALNGFGRVTAFGIVHGITTNGTAYGETWADGDTIWYNPTTGNPTKTKPVAPNIKVQIGIIISAGSGSSGSIFVEISHGSILGGTDSNVQITSPATNNLLVYNGTYWVNQSTLVPVAVSDQANTSTGYFSPPLGTTAQRPATPQAGSFRMNSTTGLPEWYSSATNAWYAFNAQPTTANYLVVAGGGGAACLGGGGGAGGMLTGSAALTAGATYTVTVGGGGNGGSNGTAPTQGSASSISGTGVSVSTVGGGLGGGNFGVANNAGSGGSGAGAGAGGGGSVTGGSGTSGQGNAGGTLSTQASPYYSAAGGGAGAAGQGTTGPNNGGVGLTSTIITTTQATTYAVGQVSGGSVYYAGGGGGTGWSNSGGSAGSGGLGGGGQPSASGNGGAGTTNTGGGGGGSGYPGSSLFRVGGAGGSGVVIMSIPTANYTGSYTGTVSVTTSGTNTILIFTGSGTYTA